MNKGEVWFVEFPLEEDESKSINRPVIVDWYGTLWNGNGDRPTTFKS